MRTAHLLAVQIGHASRWRPVAIACDSHKCQWRCKRIFLIYSSGMETYSLDRVTTSPFLRSCCM